MEHKTDDGLISMDIALPLPGDNSWWNAAPAAVANANSLYPTARSPASTGKTKSRGGVRSSHVESSKGDSIDAESLLDVAHAPEEAASDILSSPTRPVVPSGDLRGIAIEVDGPSHFLNSHPDESDGSTQVSGAGGP